MPVGKGGSLLFVISIAVQCRLSPTPSSNFTSPSHPCTCASPLLIVFHPKCPSISCMCFSAFFTSAGKPVSTYLFLGILRRIPVVSAVLSLSLLTRLKTSHLSLLQCPADAAPQASPSCTPHLSLVHRRFLSATAAVYIHPAPRL